MESNRDPNAAFVSKAIRIARKNWRAWQADFEGGGVLLLSDQSRFNAFCTEYGVGRTIRAGTRDALRERLSERLREALRDDTGDGLDLLEQELRPEFGTRQGRGRMISVLSKMAAFVRPERFVAWDSFARRGVNVVLGRAISYPFRTYAEYMAALDLVWHGHLGKRIRRCVRDHAQNAVERKAQFQRRVLDVCLMIRGGRWNDRPGSLR